MYVGQYRNGLRHGKGVYVFKNGARYNGDWRHGQKYGQGIFWYPDGTRYEGTEECTKIGSESDLRKSHGHVDTSICIFIQLFLCRTSEILEKLRVCQEFERGGCALEPRQSVRSLLRSNEIRWHLALIDPATILSLLQIKLGDTIKY